MDNSASNINVDQLTTEEKMKLTSGKDFWASEALPDHKIPVSEWVMDPAYVTKPLLLTI